MEWLLALVTAVAVPVIGWVVRGALRALWAKLHSPPAPPKPSVLDEVESHVAGLRDELSGLSLRRTEILLQLTKLQAGLEATDRRIDFIREEIRRLAESGGGP